MVMRAPTKVPSAAVSDAVTIYEVGPRDGLQNETAVIPAAVKAEFIARLGRVGLTHIEAAGFVHPHKVPQLGDAEAVLAAMERLPGVRYPVLVPTLAGLQRARASGSTDVVVFASATETFSRRNLGRSVDDALEMFRPVVEAARGDGVLVRGYVSMCFGDPWEGEVPFRRVVQVATTLMRFGCTQVALGDTIGVGTPGQVARLVGRLEAEGVPRSAMAVHFHDTYGQALANVYAALEAGVRVVDSSAGGLGGCPFAGSSAGNLATEDLVWMLEGLGLDTGVDLERLVETSVWMADQLGRPSPSRTVQALSHPHDDETEACGPLPEVRSVMTA